MEKSVFYNVDLRIFDSLTIYFELDSLSSRLKNMEGDESFPDSLERLTVCQYEDSLDSPLDSLDSNKDTENFSDSLELLIDSLEDSDTEFYSLDAVRNVSNTLYKEQMETTIRIETPWLDDFPEHVHSHVGCQHTLLQDYLSQSPVKTMECLNVLDFLILFGEKRNIQAVAELC